MKNRTRFLVLPGLLMALATVAFVACESTDMADSSGGQMAGGKGMMKPPFGGPSDMRRASTLWSTMRNYKSWASYPGMGGWQPGKSPHGKVLRYYINSVAARNAENPRDGYILIKENYGMKDGPLMAITVMQKIRGYDPDDQDWFWVKFAPDGSVMKNPKGMSLAGKVAKGMPKGCIACHSNAGGGDFLFIND